MRAALLAALVALLVALDPGGWLAAFELRTLDARHRAHAAPTAASGQIVILDIGEATIARLAPIYGRWPWPRSVHAEVVDYLAQDGASAIGFDVLFAESADRQEIDARTLDTLTALAAAADLPEVQAELLARLAALRPQGGDAQLAAAAAAAGNVFPAAVFAGGGLLAGENVAADAVADDEAPRVGSVPVPATDPAAVQRHGLLPYAALSAAARGIGHINVLPDADGVVRRYTPLTWWRDAERAVPALGLAIVAHARDIPLAHIRRHGAALWLGELALPLNADGSAYIPYQGVRSIYGHIDSAWRHIPYEQVLASKDLRAAGRATPLAPGTFRDRIVLISALAAGIADLRATPFSAVTPGIELHASIIDGLLAGRVLRAPGPLVDAVIVLLASLLVAWIAARWRPAIGLGLSLMIAAALASACWIAFARGWILPLVPPLVAVGLTHAGVLLLRTRTAERERRWLRDAFGHYLAPAVLDELLRAPAGLRLGGERREMTVLFSDIVGFTGLSERLPPEEVGRLLNAYLDRMAACVLETRGTLDKFVGDAVMAEWNAPLAQTDHAARACETALRMLQEVDRADAAWRAGGSAIDIRIGINSGELLVGNMGSPQVFDYTVLGNEVNTAARLEPLNKAYGTRIIVAEATRHAAEQQRPGDFAFRALGGVLLKGRAQPLRIHQLVGWRVTLDAATAASLEVFEDALALFLDRRFGQALVLFGSIQQLRPDDGPSAHFIARCAACSATPLADDWDGAYEQTEK